MSDFLFVGYNQSLRRESNCILFCIFNYVTSLILISVNFGLSGKQLATSTIQSEIKGQEMEEACKFGYKIPRKIFGVEELSSVQNFPLVTSSKARLFYVINFNISRCA